jgi:hypothetical protein
MYTYNTNQVPLKLKEYGRNVQRLVAHLEQIKDKSRRTQYAQDIIKVMEILHNPGNSTNTKSATDYTQKRWDDLFIISDYKLDINIPYPTPAQEILIKKPEPLEYPKQPVKYRHCGRNVGLLIKKAVEVTDPAKQAEMIIAIAKLIKNFSAAWNKDNLDIHTIMRMIQDLAGDKLIVDLEKLKSDKNFNISNNGSMSKEKNIKEKYRVTHKNTKNKLSLATKTK